MTKAALHAYRRLSTWLAHHLSRAFMTYRYATLTLTGTGHGTVAACMPRHLVIAGRFPIYLPAFCAVAGAVARSYRSYPYHLTAPTRTATSLSLPPLDRLTFICAYGGYRHRRTRGIYTAAFTALGAPYNLCLYGSGSYLLPNIQRLPAAPR